MSKVAVIGGGPAGMLAACTAAECGHSVTLFERNEKLGKKLYLTGKGRCNITNTAEIEDFFLNIPRNPRFLYSALYGFTNRDILELIEKNGTPTKEERGGRIFPVSDKSSDVIRALSKALANAGVQIRLNCGVSEVKKENEQFYLSTTGSFPTESFDALILATGGVSYKSTGSTGDGYRFAKTFGHSLVEPKPSLIPLITEEDWAGELMGLSLRNVKLSAHRGKKKLYEEQGEMLFTHFGVSGPLVLSASSRMAEEPSGVVLTIDLKPALSPEQLDKRILRDFTENSRKQLVNVLPALLPAKLVPVMIRLSGIDPETPVNAITREERQRLLELLKALPLHVKGAAPIDQAIITRGGIQVKEINASTMESKLCPGLYMAGEMLDVDAYTGGFNLQIAYSTGALAGRSIP